MSTQKSESSKTLEDELWVPVLAFEAKQLSTNESNVWFSELVKSGYIWKLPTYYVEHAAKLLDHGIIGNPQRELDS